MGTENLWNVYVRLDNRQDREFTVTCTAEEVRKLGQKLEAMEHVVETSSGIEYGDWRPFDVIEEVAAWIDGEY